METYLASWKLAKALSITPSFPPTPPAFKGPAHEALFTALGVSLGLLAFPVVMEGFFTRKLFLWKSGLVSLATIGLLWPHTPIRIVGFLIFGSVYQAKKLTVRRTA